MAKHRNALPQLDGRLFVTNGGLETTLIYHENIQLPYFAAFDILKDPSRCQWLKSHLRTFVNIAQNYGVGILLESATWRASPDWMEKLRYSDEDMIKTIQKSIELLEEVRNEYESEDFKVVINASVGPRGDGYNPSFLMTPEQAQMYHSKQFEILSQTNADMITAVTLNYPDEAIGVVRAAKQFQMPVVISFTIENDGKLPTGHTLKEAIELVENATDKTPVYYMVNCAHPTVLQSVDFPDEDWALRIRGIQGNASKKSHAELDESTELDSGDPVQFGKDIQALLYKLKNLNVLGGCCGTDDRHVEQICQACVPAFDEARNNHREKS